MPIQLQLKPLSDLKESDLQPVLFIWTNRSGCVHFAKKDNLRGIRCSQMYGNLPEPDGWVEPMEVSQ